MNELTQTLILINKLYDEFHKEQEEQWKTINEKLDIIVKRNDDFIRKYINGDLSK